MAQYFDLPSELWFKIITCVLSDSIHLVCFCTTGAVDPNLSWERNAFETLRLVSKLFSHTAFKVAYLALAGKCVKIRGVPPVGGEEDKFTVDEEIDDLDKLKLIYDRFRMIKHIHSESDQHFLNFVSQNGLTILSAYFGYARVIKNCKTLLARSNLFPVHPDPETNEFVPAYLAFIEKIHDLFPTAIKNILNMLDLITFPEMVENLRREIEWNSKFIASGLEIVYRCAQVIDQQDELQSPDISTEFQNYLDGIYAMMKVSAEVYISEFKDRVPDEYPIISKLPGVGAVTKLIVRNGYHHQALADLVNSWA